MTRRSAHSITTHLLRRLAIPTLILLLLLYLSQPPPRSPPHSDPLSAPPSSPPAAAPALLPSVFCPATRFPSLCLSTIPPAPSPLHLLHSALALPSSSLPSSIPLVHSLLSPRPSPTLLSAARRCLRFLDLSSRRLTLASGYLPADPPSAHASASAALLHQYDCLSSLKYANDTPEVDRAMRSLLSLSALTSNALSLLLSHRRFSSSASPWRAPRTERSGLWDPPSPAPARRRGVPGGLVADARVCSRGGGDGCYRTIQEAVDAAPDHSTRRFVIRIGAGIYDETVRVPFEKTNVVLLGAGMGRTVVTASRNARADEGVTTYETATVGVWGDGFMARDLTIENSAGAGARQAVAFRCGADRAVMERVEFLGHQDTLYAHALRQYYKSCRIEGTVDFVFGNAAAVFRGCELLVRPRLVNPEKGEKNAVTAQGRTDPAQPTGFVFWDCVVNGTEEYVAIYRRRPAAHRNYLGRPWKEYARVVFLNCTLGELIRPEGWLPWRGEFALETLFYGEFGSHGLGANVAGRVAWSTRIPRVHIGMYSEESFIQADEWVPLQER